MAVMVVGEEAAIGASATESVVGAAMFTAAVALPEVPAVLVAVAVMWCAPVVRGTEVLIEGAEPACCQARAESTKTCHLAMAYGELALATTRAGEAGCTGCRLTEMFAGVTDCEVLGRKPADPQPKPAINNKSKQPVTTKRTRIPPKNLKIGKARRLMPPRDGVNRNC